MQGDPDAPEPAAEGNIQMEYLSKYTSRNKKLLARTQALFDNPQHSTICYLSSPVGARLKEFNCNTSHINCILVNGNQKALLSPILSFLHNNSQRDFNHITHQLLQLIVQYIPNPTIIATLNPVQ
jgi:hypothetical protein